MPSTNQEARQQILLLLDEQERTISWLARKLGEHRMWVSNRLKGHVGIQVEDYARMLAVLEPEAIRAGN